MPRFTGYVLWFFWTRIFSEKMIAADTIQGELPSHFSAGCCGRFSIPSCSCSTPAAISLPVHTSGEFSELIYFSFVRLTPLGYGEITPVSWMAQNLTLLEAVWGQTYLVVRVVRLVGLHLSGGLVNRITNRKGYE